MNNSNGVSSYLAGPGGRFDLANPSTQAMVKDVMGNPAIAPKYGISLPEIFQLHQLLKQISTQTPQPQQTTVADDLKAAALATIQTPNAAPPQMPQAPQGIQQAMPQAQMPQDPMEQGLGGMPAPAMDNAQFAGGGIVAFAGEDEQLVSGLPPFGVPPGAPEEGAAPGTSAEMYALLRREAEQRKAELGAAPTQEGVIASQRKAMEAAGITGKAAGKRLKKLEEEAGKDTGRGEENARFALAKAGFKMAEAASRRGAGRTGFLGAAAEGASAGLADYVSAQKELRNLQAARDKEVAEIERLQRAEDMGIVKDASAAIDKHRARIDAADKSIADINVDVARMMSQREGRKEEITSQDERARLDRESRERQHKESMAVQAAARVPDIVQLVRSKEFQDAYGTLPKDKQFEQAAKLKQTAEKTFGATEATYRTREKAFDEMVSTDQKLRALRSKALAGDEEAKRKFNALREEYVGRPSGGTTSPRATPATGAGQFSVSAPNGKVYSFPTQEAADQFAKSIGK